MLGVSGRARLRDMWKHQDLGSLSSPCTTVLPSMAL
jgi:hypothetical protein